MNAKQFLTTLLGASFLTLAALPSNLSAAEPGGVEDSYHGQLGFGTGLGMLEKWCALPNFSYLQQSGIEGWTAKDCNNCHIGGAWNKDKPVNCGYCHDPDSPDGEILPMEAGQGCLSCHWKDSAKRGDSFDPANDVHIAMGYECHHCHLKDTDENGISDHQFRKGTAIDTTETTMMGTISCTHECHTEQPHMGGSNRADRLNEHTAKVACETCHTGLRPAKALASRQWNVFVTNPETGKKSPRTTKQAEGWLPKHKWYDNTGAGASGDFHLPMLSYTERRDAEGAKIYPFNEVTVDWFVKKKHSSYDEVVIVPEVLAADANGDDTVTLEEMQAVYRKARLVTADMNFSISHSVVPASDAFNCDDCHGDDGWVLDWEQLGYDSDPRDGSGKGKGKKK